MEFYNIVKRSNNIITAPHCSSLTLDNNTTTGASDRGTDMVAQCVGEDLNFTVITSNYSRLVLDFNSPRNEAIPTKFNHHEIAEVSEEEKTSRLKHYDQYFQALTGFIEDGSFHVSLHSMSPVGMKSSKDEGVKRPDFRIGTLNGKTADKKRATHLKKVLEDRGYSVELNNIFCGKEEIRRSHEAGAESVQIEINSKFLLNLEEQTIDTAKMMDTAELVTDMIKEFMNFR